MSFDAKPDGYLYVMKSGIKSGTAHRSTLDFWKIKEGERVITLYSAETIQKYIDAGKTASEMLADMLARDILLQKEMAESSKK